MHPLLQLAASQPQLLVDHAQAYVELVAAELPRAAAGWKHQALLKALGLLGLLAALLLAGVALMLWATLPMPPMPNAWLLIAVPSLPAVAAITCLVVARAKGESTGLGGLHLQVNADLAMLREATTS